MKGLRTTCSECGTATVFQEITIDFERKGVKAVVSGVPAMVCPRWGEKYVPGEIAGEAKFWLDSIALAANYGFRAHELNEIERTIRERWAELMEAWHERLD